MTVPELVDGSYRFETPAMTLALSASADRHGIVSLQPASAAAGPGVSRELVQPNFFLLNIYRLFSTGRLLAIARLQPFEAAVEQGTVWLRWRPTELHPARLNVSYTVPAPDTVDVTLEVVAEQPLPGYEALVSSYFAYSLAPYVVVPSRPVRPARAGAPRDEPPLRLLRLERSPFVEGNYILVARDVAGIRQRLDGRYHDAAGRPVAHFASGQLYAHPISVMAGDALHLVQMTHSGVCPSMITTYVEPDAPPGQPQDNIARHNASYFGFWGDDLAPGERRTARLRQVLRPGRPTLEGVLALHDAFLAESDWK